MRNIENNPLGEVFGYPIENETTEALQNRVEKLCPYNNSVSQCTKDKKKNPLGVCSVHHNGEAIITCPVRFRENFLFLEEAAKFFFPDDAEWKPISEIKLLDAGNNSAGNIDYALARLNDAGDIIDFGSIEVQGVYITGNLRDPFAKYLASPSSDFSWRGQENYPKPDYLSSSRKRLIPQMLSKGGILKHWNKKQAVVIQKAFFNTLPELKRVTKDEADIAWFLYNLEYSDDNKKYHLVLAEVVYTLFEDLVAINSFLPGEMANFVGTLKKKLESGSKKKSVKIKGGKT